MATRAIGKFDTSTDRSAPRGTLYTSYTLRVAATRLSKCTGRRVCKEMQVMGSAITLWWDFLHGLFCFFPRRHLAHGDDVPEVHSSVMWLVIR